ncbi:hypothetical protein J19TS2_55880 [Cohnella xylanilytica]|uniref:excinuclease ABC subunit UvrA n=1 Tax=Cohnella xylanilytica TaxID=557555 RepID=UPI001B1EBB87|nr:excinuclease ABC subunit UvrA [Cohnella xylanilytica]GIO16033.1 hypothetical protein J19TS2_55880 [Cohnella xylanilytica]
MQREFMEFRGVREHNLKGIDVALPKRKLVAVVGVSGSGKSSFVFDVLCKEAERQYLMTIGRIAEHLARPRFDSVGGLSAVVSVSQSGANSNPRSTVGTYTEIYTYLRLLYLLAGDRTCMRCQAVTSASSAASASSGEGGPDTCRSCGAPLPVLTLAHLSYNTPQGACATCKGLGEALTPDPDVLLDPKRSVVQGGILAWNKGTGRFFETSLTQAAKFYGLPFTAEDMHTPIGELHPAMIDLLLYGTNDWRLRRLKPDANPPKTAEEGRFEGAVPAVQRRFFDNPEHVMKEDSELRALMKKAVCPSCQGKRVNEQALSLAIRGADLAETSALSMGALLERLRSWQSYYREQAIYPSIESVVRELESRCRSLLDVGLSYVSLDRPFFTLSGGEAQRVRLASSLHSELTDLVFVYDEPSSGLHPQDTMQLFRALKRLRERGNTVIVVEHDLSLLELADHIIELGPESGKNGGEIVAQGTLADLMKSERSVTRRYVDGGEGTGHSARVSRRRLGSAEDEFGRTDGNKEERVNRKPMLRLTGASARNLKGIDVRIPLGAMTAIAGVSGSGKTTLLFEELLPRLAGRADGCVTGAEPIGRVVVFDQDEMGRSSRSTAATYTGVFDGIRALFGARAKQQGLPYKASHFSYNVKGGRCENCLGHGTVKMDMHFMPDVHVACDACGGRRYRPDLLAVRYRGLSIADVLELTVREAAELFAGEAAIEAKLDLLIKLGLGYLQLGQQATTLSGGEARRVKMAAELGVPADKHTLYVLDEPTTGLHPRDVELVGDALEELAGRGHTVVFIEHKPMLLGRADWLIELGPTGGEDGGYLLCEGTPEQVRANPASQIGPYLSAAGRPVEDAAGR